MIKSVKSSFISLDVKICRSIYQYSEKYYVDRLMYYFSKSADGVWYFFLGLFIVLYNFKIGTKISLIVLIAFVLEIALQKLIKLFVKERGPAG